MLSFKKGQALLMEKSYFVKIKNTNSLDLKLQVIEVGDFRKGFVGLVCQLHGDEYSSLVIISKLLKKVGKGLMGVRIILNANPLGSLMGIKNEPLTNQNLNRMFSDKLLSVNLAQTLALEISKLVKDAQFVIDIHDMPGSRVPICSILTMTGNLDVEQTNRSLISKFGPQVCWIEDFSKTEMAKRYSGTINSFLNRLGVANFTIETSGIDSLSDQEAEEVSKKLVNLISGMAKEVEVEYFEREELYSPAEGVITPTSLKLLANVKVGEKLGVIFNGEEIVFKSPKKGVLIRMTSQRFVKKGEKIFDIGVKL